VRGRRPDGGRLEDQQGDVLRPEARRPRARGRPADHRQPGLQRQVRRGPAVGPGPAGQRVAAIHGVLRCRQEGRRRRGHHARPAEDPRPVPVRRAGRLLRDDRPANGRGVQRRVQGGQAGRRGQRGHCRLHLRRPVRGQPATRSRRAEDAGRPRSSRGTGPTTGARRSASTSTNRARPPAPSSKASWPASSSSELRRASDTWAIG
jgi:hypothetical protein